MFKSMQAEYEFVADENEYLDDYGNTKIDNLFDEILGQAEDLMTEAEMKENFIQLIQTDKRLFNHLLDAFIDYCYAVMDEHELDSVLSVGPVIKMMEEIKENFKK